MLRVGSLALYNAIKVVLWGRHKSFLHGTSGLVSWRFRAWPSKRERDLALFSGLGSFFLFWPPRQKIGCLNNNCIFNTFSGLCLCWAWSCASPSCSWAPGTMLLLPWESLELSTNTSNTEGRKILIIFFRMYVRWDAFAKQVAAI